MTGFLETLFYLFIGAYIIHAGIEILKKRPSQVEAVPEKVEPKPKQLIFELSEEDFKRIRRGGHFIIEFKRNPIKVNWDEELKKI